MPPRSAKKNTLGTGPKKTVSEVVNISKGDVKKTVQADEIVDRKESVRVSVKEKPDQQNRMTNGEASVQTGGGSKVISFQFGSLSPGLVNGMQIPARTSSAPPNLDEQKRDQARNGTSRNTQAVPIPAVPKKNVPQKEPNAVTNSSSVATPIPKTKETQSSSLPMMTRSVKPPIHAAPPMSTHVPFHQPQASHSYGVPNAPMQPQGITMPISMPVPIGSAPQVQQPVFLPTIQQHLVHPSGMIPQGQGISYPTSMGPQLNPQIGNYGMGIAAPYCQQQAGNLIGSRKSVTITDPKTRELVNLDKRAETHGDSGSSAPKIHPGMPSQSQPLPSFVPGHPLNFFQPSYGTNMFFSTSNSVPLAGAPESSGSQAVRFNYQVGQTPHFNHPVTNKTGNESLNFGTSVVSSAPVPQVTIKPSPVTVKPSVGLKGGTHKSVKIIDNVASVSQKVTEILPEVSQQQTQSRPGHGLSPSISVLPTNKQSVTVAATVPSDSALCSVSEESTYSDCKNGVRRKETFNKSDCSMDHLKKPSIEVKQASHVSDAFFSAPNLSSQVIENKLSSNDISVKHEAQERDVPILSVENANLVDSAPNTDTTGSSGQKAEMSSCHMSATDVITEKKENRKTESRQAGEQENVQSVVSKKLEKTPSEAQSIESIDVSTEQTTLSSENETTIPRTDASSESNAEPEAFVQVHCNEDKRDNSLISSSKIPDSSNLQFVAANSISSSSDTDGAMPSVNVNKGGKVSAVKASLSGQDSVVCGSTLDSTSKPEIVRSKSTLTRAKKKRKEMFQKADAAGASDLYNAYKGPEEKKKALTSCDKELQKVVSLVSAVPGETVSVDKISENKFEPDDWEDAADISTTKLENSCDREQSGVKSSVQGADIKDTVTKKYSRDFLLKFSEKCWSLPEDFDMKPEIEVLIIVDMNFPYRSSGGSRLNRHVNGLGDDDKWSKLSGGRMDTGYGNSLADFRPGQGANYGIPRNSRMQHSGQFGGLLSGPVHSSGTHGGIQRNMSGADADRWQRSTGIQKGLIPSPQASLPAMHKAEKKYEVGKVAGEEQAKQRQLKAILNKLTPQNFEKLFEQVTAVNIDNAITLTGVISQIFDKALTEPTFCEMYANFCSCLSVEMPDFSEDNEKITFKRLLLNKCQEEFEKGEREEEEANKVEDGISQTEEGREEKRIKARRRMLGNIRLIGELYKKKMLTERIMHECIVKLLGQSQALDEEDIEALCKLMSTIGEIIDHAKAKEHMDAYFDRMADLSNNMALSSRMRFMLKDAIDLRKNKWQQRRKVEGPKKIEEVHRDAAHERQAQAGRLSRGPGMNPSIRRNQPTEFTQRLGALPSNTQAGSYRALPSQSRGFGVQDVRFEERSSHEGRPLSVPLSQRPISDDSITLGPQGGLGRGMSLRGQSSAVGASPVTGMSSSSGLRRTSGGVNGYSSTVERTACSSREDLPRLASERYSLEQAGSSEHGTSHVNRVARTDSGVEKILPEPSTQASSAEMVLSEERLRNMSILAIKEFYSAKDEKEVAMCIKDLNSPAFYPTMISLWVNDSFEQKDFHRDLLAKLLVDLTTATNAMLTGVHLMKGFEVVVTTLEDTVNDAPRAAEFLGKLFARIILENVVSLSEIGRLIHEGGEEPGSLREAGLAAEVLGNTLDTINVEKGQSVLDEIRAKSNLFLEDFRHPDSSRSKKLEMFM